MERAPPPARRDPAAATEPARRAPQLARRARAAPAPRRVAQGHTAPARAARGRAAPLARVARTAAARAAPLIAIAWVARPAQGAVEPGAAARRAREAAMARAAPERAAPTIAIVPAPAEWAADPPAPTEAARRDQLEWVRKAREPALTERGRARRAAAALATAPLGPGHPAQRTIALLDRAPTAWRAPPAPKLIPAGLAALARKRRRRRARTPEWTTKTRAGNR